MAKTLALITLHGMGDTASDYADELFERLRREVGQPTWDRVVHRSIYYQGILQNNQAAIFGRMRAQIDWMQLRKFLLYGFSDAGSLEYKKEVLGSPYWRTQKEIRGQLDQVFAAAGAVPLIVVAQSLGGHVISSYIWDALRQPQASVGVWHGMPTDGVAGGSAQDRFRRMRTLVRLYTTGCNIPLFVAGHPSIEAIPAPHAQFRWFNFFDEDDVLGWPLQPLSPSYDQLVEDVAVNAGSGLVGTLGMSWNPLSHEAYWQDAQVLRHIAASIRQFA